MSKSHQGVFLVHDRTCNTRVTGVVFESNPLTMTADQIEIHAFLNLRQLGIAALPSIFQFAHWSQKYSRLLCCVIRKPSSICSKY